MNSLFLEVIMRGSAEYNMVWRRVKPIMEPREGTIIKWEPLGGAMCDVLVQHDDGYECWYGSSSLRPVDGLGDLPSRREAQEENDFRMRDQLQSILDKFVQEEMQPHSKRWPGAEFGKYVVGQAITRALEEVEARIKERESS